MQSSASMLLLVVVAAAATQATTQGDLQQRLLAAEARAAAAHAEAAELRQLLQAESELERHAALRKALPPSTATRHPNSERAGQPVAFWASEPVKPGELQGATDRGFRGLT